MTERQQRLCVWGGITFAPLFLIGFALVAGFVPPPSPGMSADAVARMFAEGRGRIRIGIWIACAAAPFLAFFVWMVAMTWLMLRASRIAERAEAQTVGILQPSVG